MIRLYDFLLSGNAHKVRNQLSLFGLSYETVEVDLLAGEQRQDAFLTLNPLAQVPVLIDDDVVIRDSAAILVYLGRKLGRGHWLPIDAVGEARVHEWLAVSAHDVVEGPARARLIELFGAPGDLAAARVRAQATLGLFDRHLEGRAFLAAEHPTIADVANYSYLALAPDGGVPLDGWRHVRAWMERLEKLPGFVPVPERPAPIR